MKKYTEARLEETIIGLLQKQGYTYVKGEAVARTSKEEVLIIKDIQQFLKTRYQQDNILDSEIVQLIRQFKNLSSAEVRARQKVVLFIYRSVTLSAARGIGQVGTIRQSV